MKLQEKTSLILVILLIAILALISVFVSAVSLASYSALEHQYVLEDVDLAVNRLGDEYASLSTIVADWGPWDETYEFVNGNRADYVENNLVPDVYRNLRLNFIVMTNQSGGIVYAGAYDIRNHTMSAAPDALRKQLTPDSPLVAIADPRDTVTGIVMIGNRPALVASRPIIHSDFSGSPQGVVVMGRYLDDDEVAYLAKLTRPTLRFVRPDDSTLPPSILPALMAGQARGTGVVTPLAKGTIGGYALVRDVNGRVVLVLEIREDRDIYGQGVTSTIQYVLIVLAAGLLFGVVFLLILDRLVLSRVTSLSRQVQEISSQPALSQRMDIGGNDELFGLSREINRMLDTIEKTHEGLLQSEARFRELAELLPQIIFEMDTTGRLLYVNRAAFVIFGLDSSRIDDGRSIWEFIIPEDTVRARAGMEKVLGGAPSSGEIYHLKRPDGTIMSAIVYTAPIHRNGNLAGLRGIIIDITDRINLEEALTESQEYLQTLLWSVRAGIIVIDAETHTIVDANPAALEMIGATKDQLIGRVCHNFICPETEGQCPITDYHRSVDNTECDLVTCSGEKISIIKYVVPVLLDGKTCILETFIDNTARKKVERDLRESTDLLTGILRASPVGVFRLDADGRVTFINDTFTRITGLSEEHIIGQLWVRTLYKDDQDGVIAALAGAVRDRKIARAETRFVHQDGSVYWLLGQAVPLVSPQGTLAGWVGTINDITQQKKIETALRESEEKYRALTENTADILISSDTSGNLQYISPQIRQFGFLPSSLLDQNITDLVFPDDRQMIARFFKNEIGNSRRSSIVFRIHDSNKAIHWMEGNTSPKHGPDGKTVVGIFGILRDITDRKRDEDAIHLANKKLNLMNDITRHDILNTITGLFGLIDMAVASDNREELSLLLSQIKESGRLIQRQITFTRDYQGVGVHAPVWQNVEEVVSRAAASLSRPGLAVGIDVENMEVFADPLLEKVFYNLIDNAIRYGERVTRIQFYFLISDLGITLVCEDNGVGVPPGAKETIFERGVGKNTGMGLFLTREILMITGISIRENGDPGEGARFEMRIPNGMWRFAR